MAKISKIYPQFVTMRGGSALRLIYDGKRYSYYRDGGCWETHVRIDKNVDFRTTNSIDSLNDCILTVTTEEEWRKCNGQYAPSNFTRYGWELETTSQPIKKEERNNKYKYILIRR